mmetsp:Transcript_5895/g.16759  ORF Transcript_5895/g.16759 Transcript_5895/m.16759 type:complete len:569 (-) Transcript_5895:290-1996(-)
MLCGRDDGSGTSDDSDSDSESSKRPILHQGGAPPVPESFFAAPESTARGGGTAAFFRVRYTGPPGPPAEKYGKSEDYWIAKDLAHAVDELSFYEEVSLLGPEYRLLHRFAMDYGGILRARCMVGERLEPKPRELLLLKNLREGLATCRMLDIKIGSKTAVAGWQGKSRSAARRNEVVDRMTNSSKQGFRLEGFDNPGEGLRTQQEGEPGGCPCMRLGKKGRRFTLQRLKAPEFLRHWVDFADLSEQAEAEGESVLTPTEYSEYVLFDMIRQLAALCVDAREMPVPQMWIGSSVALVCDGGALPGRQRALQALAPGSPERAARLSVFDWGRSELNTAERHAALPERERGMREEFWSIWLRGCLRLLFDAVVLYRNTFGASLTPECLVQFRVFDHDTHDANDLIGTATLPLAPTDGPVTLELEHHSCHLCRRPAEIDVEVSAVPLPSAGSRLSQMWRVTVVSVSNLPHMDLFSLTDPIVEVKVINTGSALTPLAYTPVVYNDNDAEFGAHLGFGQARPDVLDALLGEVGAAFGEPVGAPLFPKCRGQKATAAFNDFLAGVGRFAGLAVRD